MIFSDLPSPADLPSPKRSRFGFAQAGAGFAKAGNRSPLFGIMLYCAVVRFGNHPMCRLALLALVSAAMAALAPAAAQQPSRPSPPSVAPSPTLRPPAGSPQTPRPYQPLAVTLSLGPQDASFETFRKELTAVAKSRVYAELARLVTRQGLFWDRDFNNGFDRKRPAVDNLAAALRLEQRSGMGWTTLAMFAAETTAAPFTGRLGVICAPATPSYDAIDFDRLIDVTRSSARDWAYPRADQTIVHAAPKSAAAVVDTLGLAFVRVLGYEAKDNEPDTIRAAWARVATLAGKIGFVAPGALMTLSPERLCYGKDGFGRWSIAGYVSGGE
jgi:hypothetical protein